MAISVDIVAAAGVALSGNRKRVGGVVRIERYLRLRHPRMVVYVAEVCGLPFAAALHDVDGLRRLIYLRENRSEEIVGVDDVAAQRPGRGRATVCTVARSVQNRLAVRVRVGWASV